MLRNPEISDSICDCRRAGIRLVVAAAVFLAGAAVANAVPTYYWMGADSGGDNWSGAYWLLVNTTSPLVTLPSGSTSAQIFGGTTAILNSSFGSVSSMNIGGSHSTTPVVSGNGLLDIQAGGALTATSVALGTIIGPYQGAITQEGGSLTVTTTERIGVYGSSYYTQSGGINSVATLIFGTGAATAAGGTYNLNGGTLTAQVVSRDIYGNATFDFNGGTLKPGAASATFMQGLTVASVQAGGAIIDTTGFDVTVGQALLTGASPDGGLTKKGSNTLTLSGANTYTGLTTVNAGTLELGVNAQNPVLTLGGKADILGGKLVFDYTGGSASSIWSTIQSAVTAGTIYRPSTNPPLICIDDLSNTVTVESTLFGDANLDGTVNGADLNTVLSNYNQTGMDWARATSTTTGRSTAPT